MLLFVKVMDYFDTCYFSCSKLRISGSFIFLNEFILLNYEDLSKVVVICWTSTEMSLIFLRTFVP